MINRDQGSNICLNSLKTLVSRDYVPSRIHKTHSCQLVPHLVPYMEAVLLRREKLVKKAQQDPGSLTFMELCWLAERFDFQRRQGKGSHARYVHREIRVTTNFQPGKNGEAKAYQVRQFLTILKSHGLLSE